MPSALLFPCHPCIEEKTYQQQWNESGRYFLCSEMLSSRSKSLTTKISVLFLSLSLFRFPLAFYANFDKCHDREENIEGFNWTEGHQQVGWYSTKLTLHHITTKSNIIKEPVSCRHYSNQTLKMSRLNQEQSGFTERLILADLHVYAGRQGFRMERKRWDQMIVRNRLSHC